MASTTPARIRVQWRDEYRNLVKRYVSPADARALDQSGAATWKQHSKTEMNLRDGLQLQSTEMGAVLLAEVFFVGAPTALAVSPILEKWHRLRLNCQSWTRFAACRDPYQPKTSILSLA